MTPATDAIRGFLQNRFPTATLGDDDDIFALGYVNSLFAMELVVFIEQGFDLQLPNDELNIENFRSISAMTDLVERQLKQRIAR